MKFGIYRKVLALVCGLNILFAWVFGSYFSRQYILMLNHEMDARGEILVSNLAANSEYPVIINDSAALRRLVKGAMALKDVVFCRIERSDGALLYQDGSREVPVKEYTAPIVTKKIAEGRGEELILSIPSQSEVVIGRMTLAISIRDLGVAEQKTIETTLIAALLSIMLSALIYYIVLRRTLGRPIAELVSATKRISEGELDYQVPIRTRDELGALAASFNKMTRSLSDTQDELVRKEKLAILGQLSGSVGHELRNPLGVINNAIYFLKTVLPGADQIVKEYLEMIRNEVNNAERIISDLLDFARTKTPQTRPVTAAEFIQACLGKCSIPETVKFSVDVPPTLPAVAVDPLQMGQVFQNLIMNAVQAMPEGGRLRVSARLTKDEKASGVPASDASGHPSSVKISIADTGEGITPENRKKLFQPLFTTKAKGIGLGLTVVKKLIEANGGRIEVESQPGRGTVFTVIFPAAGAATLQA